MSIISYNLFLFPELLYIKCSYPVSISKNQKYGDKLFTKIGPYCKYFRVKDNMIHLTTLIVDACKVIDLLKGEKLFPWVVNVQPNIRIQFDYSGNGHLTSDMIIEEICTKNQIDLPIGTRCWGIVKEPGSNLVKCGIRLAHGIRESLEGKLLNIFDSSNVQFTDDIGLNCCTNCFHFDHKSKDCKSQFDKCFNCAGNLHPMTHLDCPLTKCVRCLSTSHNGTDENCPKLRETIETCIAKIDCNYKKLYLDPKDLTAGQHLTNIKRETNEIIKSDQEFTLP